MLSNQPASRQAQQWEKTKCLAMMFEAEFCHMYSLCLAQILISREVVYTVVSLSCCSTLQLCCPVPEQSILHLVDQSHKLLLARRFLWNHWSGFRHVNNTRRKVVGSVDTNSFDKSLPALNRCWSIVLVQQFNNGDKLRHQWSKKCGRHGWSVKVQTATGRMTPATG